MGALWKKIEKKCFALTAVHREDVGVDCEICLNGEINVCYHGDAWERSTQ